MTFAKHQKQLTHFKHPLAILKWNRYTFSNILFFTIPTCHIWGSRFEVLQLLGGYFTILGPCPESLQARPSGFKGEFTDETIEKP
jgi:hypothetical protein